MRNVSMILMIVAVLIHPVYSSNYPCSGKRGGVSHCEKGRFICKDNRASQSKKTCPETTFGTQIKDQASKSRHG
jgi:hypothetical protein